MVTAEQAAAAFRQLARSGVIGEEQVIDISTFGGGREYLVMTAECSTGATSDSLTAGEGRCPSCGSWHPAVDLKGKNCCAYCGNEKSRPRRSTSSLPTDSTISALSSGLAHPLKHRPSWTTIVGRLLLSSILVIVVIAALAQV